MTAQSSFQQTPKHPLTRVLFAAYLWLSAITNPIAWILDSRSKTILDVGCGQGYPMQQLKMVRKIEATGVDLFDEYLKEAKKLNIYKKLIKSDVTKLPFDQKSFDTVMCLQVIEHLPKAEGAKLLKSFERIARYQVIIATPVGYFDHPEMDENKLQRHLSGWEDRDFTKQGYTVHHVGLNVLFGNDGLVHQAIPRPIKAALFVLDHLLTPLYWFVPGFANYWIIATKRLNNG